MQKPTSSLAVSVLVTALSFLVGCKTGEDHAQRLSSQPAAEKSRGSEVTGVLRVTVNSNRTLKNVVVETSTGNKALDDAMVDTAKKLKFRSGSANYLVPFTFRLDANGTTNTISPVVVP